MEEEVKHASAYVKLKRNQVPLEDITPGELNLPVDVPQLNVHKCNECGQPLPESYRAPADEPWSTGIFACTQDAESSGFSSSRDLSLVYLFSSGRAKMVDGVNHPGYVKLKKNQALLENITMSELNQSVDVPQAGWDYFVPVPCSVITLNK